ncbi:hypothetical protein ACFHS9_23700, partial [Enterobacter hormaechei]
MNRILVITQRKILPTTDGALIYSFGLLKMLKKFGAEVSLISFVFDDDYTEDEKTILRSVVSVIKTCKLTFQSTALNMSFKYPNNIRKYTRKKMRKLLLDSFSGQQFDTVVIDHLQMYEYAKLFPNSRIVLHTHNVENELWFEYAKKTKAPIKWLINRSAKMTYCYEKMAINDADFVTAISESDASKFKKMVPEKQIVISKGFSEYDLVKTEADILSVNRNIIFIGSYSWYPNESSALYLISKIMPKLRECESDVKLILVGKDPTK